MMRRLSMTALVCAAALAATLRAASPAEDQMQFADGLFARGMYDLAVKEYIQVLAVDSQFARLDQCLYRIGECYRNLKQYEPAELFYRRVSKEHAASPYRPRADFRRAEILAAGAKHDAAAEVLRGLLAANPPADLAAGAQFLLGQSLARGGKPAEAAPALRLVIDKHPDSPYVSLACLDLAALLRTTGGDARAQEEILAKALAKPASRQVAAEALFQLGDSAFRRQDYAAASDAYARLAREFPESTRVKESALQSVWAAHRAGRYKEVVEMAAPVLAKGGAEREDEWLYLAGNSYRQLLDNAKATELYTQLLTRHPKSSLAAATAYERALIAYRQGKYAEAIQLGAAVQATPEIQQDLLWLLAESYAENKDPVNAIATFRRILETAPQGPRAPDALYRLAFLLQSRNEWAEAASFYRKLAAGYPQSAMAPQALFSSGVCLARRDQFEEAVADWSRLIKDYGTSSWVEEAVFQKALAEMRLSRDKQAMESLLDLLKRYPQTRHEAEARFWLGSLYEKTGENAEAEKQLKASLAKQPPPDLLRRVQFRLAGVCQKLGRPAEAADLLQGLLETPVRAEMSMALLEWLARFQLSRNAWPQAGQAAAYLSAGSEKPEWRQIGSFLLGEARRGEGKADEALAAFQKTVESPARTRESIEAWTRIGQIHLDAKRYDEAEKCFGKAAELSVDPAFAPVRAQALFSLGRLAEAQSKWDGAARYYMSVAVLYDDPQLTPEALFRAADMFTKAGRAADGEKTRKELAERYPESAWVKNPPK